MIDPSPQALLPPGTDEWQAGDPPIRALAVSAVCDEQVFPLFVAHPEHALGAHPFRGYVVGAADPLLHRPDVDDIVHRAHRRSRCSRGITATALTSRQGTMDHLAPVELPPEAAVLRAGELATGIDIESVRGAASAGAAPQVTPCRRSTSGVRVLYPSADLILDDLQIEHAELPGGIWTVELIARPAQPVRSLTDACEGSPLVLAASVGEDAEACRRALDLLPRALLISGRRPLTDGPNDQGTNGGISCLSPALSC